MVSAVFHSPFETHTEPATVRPESVAVKAVAAVTTVASAPVTPKPAVDEANDPYKAPISLMNGNEFVDLLCEFGIGVILEKVTIFDIDKDEINFDFPEQKEIDEKGIEIFTNYKNHKHFAIYFSSTKIIYENEVYKSPSAAGTKVQNGLPVNGWKFWKFIDTKTGKTHPLERLRKK